MDGVAFNAGLSKERYFDERGTNEESWIAYSNQLRLMMKYNWKTILEIGPGNKIVQNYLQEKKKEVATLDIVKELNPTYVGDVRNIPHLIKVDAVACFQVLEHIPWEDVEQALKSIYNAVNRYVFISVPYSALAFRFHFIFFSKTIIDKSIHIPIWLKHNISEEKIQKTQTYHYWEMGRKGTSYTAFKNKLKKYYRVVEEYQNHNSRFQYYFILEKKK